MERFLLGLPITVPQEWFDLPMFLFEHTVPFFGLMVTWLLWDTCGPYSWDNRCSIKITTAEHPCRVNLMEHTRDEDLFFGAWVPHDVIHGSMGLQTKKG